MLLYVHNVVVTELQKLYETLRSTCTVELLLSPLCLLPQEYCVVLYGVPYCNSHGAWSTTSGKFLKW